MKLARDFVQRLENLRNALENEINREYAKTAEREHAPAIVESQTPEIAIIKTNMQINPGELIGDWIYGEKPKPLGFVVKELRRKFGERIYVLNKSSIGSVDLEEEFEIYKVGFAYLLEKRLEVLNRAEDILSRFEFAEPTDERLNLDYRSSLDEHERRAVDSACSLEKGEILMVMGPPGTGKTEFISVASRILGKHEKVFVTAHTHQSVDNALERLPKDVDYALRIGPLTRISENVVRFSPEHKYVETVPLNLGYDELAEAYTEAFRKVRRERNDILYRDHFLVGSTAARSITNPLRNLRFSTTFIDESHNLCISTALLVLDKVEKAVVTGDIWQIPPVYSTINVIRERTKYGTFNFLYELMKNEMHDRIHNISPESLSDEDFGKETEAYYNTTEQSLHSGSNQTTASEIDPTANNEKLTQEASSILNKSSEIFAKTGDLGSKISSIQVVM